MRMALGMALAWVAGVGLLIAAPGASAGLVYRWTTDEGVAAFTDDAKRIPKRYRQRAVRVETEKLERYKRLTETDSVATAQYGERLKERLADLRALNGAGAQLRTGLAAAAPETVRVPLAGPERHAARRSNETPGLYERRTGLVTPDTIIPSLSIAADPSLREPVVVEHHRVRPDGAITTRTVTVVRQGDRVLSVIKPRHLHEHRALQWPKEIR